MVVAHLKKCKMGEGFWSLIGLDFSQEKRENDGRFGLPDFGVVAARKLLTSEILM